MFRRYFGRGLLCVLTGCHNAAVPYLAAPSRCEPHRNLVAVGQVVEDTAVVTVNRPLETMWSVVSETADHLRALTQGGLGKRIVLPLQGPPGPLPPTPEPLDPSALETDLRALTGRELSPANVQLYVEGQEALTALEDLIARATKQIDIIMFQWENDPLGRALVERLVARASPTLHVRVLIDGGGNLCFNEPDELPAREVNRVLLPLLHNPYIELVRIRNAFARYDHRKLVLVDGRLAWSGGRNFSREAFFEHHDLSYVLEGPLVPRLQGRFERYWRTQNGLAPEPVPEPQPLAPCDEIPQPNTRARLLLSEPNNRQISRAIYRAIDLAQRHIYVENVYLTDSLLVYKLAQARRRGVDVRVVLTVQSTTEIINRANRVVANRLLAAGVRVYLYPGMTHVKALTVDGVWAYVGTGNLDALSFRHNRELGLSVSGCPLIGQLERCLFLPDLRPEWEMTQPLPVTWCDYYAEMLASLCL
ncbi:MAG TPA: phosphatidylserine/phosphatidylglycerophosphate/cardiolipin synthase family protein [Gemmataceae bacterium]|nr:phosphatidylserine/phosphatidylglycerophosphate/cardiolipin synthase family protein [Gemmataceae bacterium]